MRADFFPKGKELGKQGFNYLTKENVQKVLDTMTELNPDDKNSIHLANSFSNLLAQHRHFFRFIINIHHAIKRS